MVTTREALQPNYVLQAIYRIIPRLELPGPCLIFCIGPIRRPAPGIVHAILSQGDAELLSKSLHRYRLSLMNFI